MENLNGDDLHLSVDPEENLRMENQFLELKLRAEFRAETFVGGNLPADIQNQFLKNVLDFEKSFSQHQETKICDILGNPCIKLEADLDDPTLELYLNKVNEMLLKENIAVDFGGVYDDRTKYKFITEELFEESIIQSGFPGMLMNFIYEEFHPNHKFDLEVKAQKFITGWFEKDADKMLWEIADRIVLPTGTVLSKREVKEQIQDAFNYYTLFSEYSYVISTINFEVNDDGGIAYVEGLVSSNTLITKNKAIAIQGPFKLTFCLEYGWWDICYFVFPGFEFE